ncbi:MAG: DUF1553 domain-containing protein [Blastocatellia bacterium]|nr:DUF1553 domain-containing protein [Blastocatellia bacterium]
MPVLTKLGCNQGACHGAAAGKNGFKLTLRGYDPELDYQVLTRQSLGRRINKIEPAKSLILLKGTMAIGHGGGKRMDVDSLEYRVLSEWIAAGIVAPSETDSRITSIAVTSSDATNNEVQLRVKATYDNGQTEDVTRWVKYAVADASVAAVDEAGKVKLIGHGESAVTAQYQSAVAFTRVTNAFPNKIAPEVFTQSPKHNYVDDLVIRKLAALNIAPSGQANDNEFIRRAYLDAAGILPTAQEVNDFLNDSSPDKRSKLINALLDREEYVDYWANKWDDLLLVSTLKINNNAMWSFHNWIRRSIQTNKPWDKFVREIITASGNTLDNGAANYFVIHKEPTDLNENLSQAFLGMSITCARCHNHPLEKWTQKQYFEMANLFGRVALKNGVRAGDVSVYTSPTGEVVLPRLNKPLPPRPLDGEAISFEGQDRREHLANWLTAPTNPYFARSVVNRLWKNFMGRGLVEAVDDMRATNPPSNEELLAALTKDFIEHKFDTKQLIRTIMNSAAYQRASDANATNAKDEKYYSKYIIKRLPAEVMLDALSQVTNVPTMFPDFAPGTRAIQLPDSRINQYFLKVFGKPPRVATCECERSAEPTVQQALHIINGETLNQKLRAPGGFVDNVMKLGLPDEMIVEHLYLSAFARKPSEKESASLVTALKTNRTDGMARRQAVEDVVWAVLTSKEFLFNH